MWRSVWSYAYFTGDTIHWQFDTAYIATCMHNNTVTYSVFSTKIGFAPLLDEYSMGMQKNYRVLNSCYLLRDIATEQSERKTRAKYRQTVRCRSNEITSNLLSELCTEQTSKLELVVAVLKTRRSSWSAVKSSMRECITAAEAGVRALSTPGILKGAHFYLIFNFFFTEIVSLLWPSLPTSPLLLLHLHLLFHTLSPLPPRPFPSSSPQNLRKFKPLFDCFRTKLAIIPWHNKWH